MQQLRWIFGLTILATLSLVGLQAYIWQQGIQQERSQLSRSLQHAVYEAAEEFMNPGESIFIVDDNQLDDSLRVRAPGFLMIQIGQADTSFSVKIDEAPASKARTRIQHLPNTLDFVDNLPSALERLQAGDTSFSFTLKGDSTPDLIEHIVTDAATYPERLTIVDQIKKYQIAIPDSSTYLSKRILSDTLSNTFFARHERLCPSCETSFSHLSGTSFEPLLKQELSRLGINAEFQWAIQHRNNWLVVDGDTSKLEKSEWKLPFFSLRSDRMGVLSETSPQGIRSSAAPLVFLYFPNEHWYLLQSMGPTLMVSSLFAFFVLGCIGYAVFVILRQKQLSEIKTDFINNMTHEFKTPISTIALACEAMQDPQVTLPESSKKHYLNMIATENDRLGTQVEKVLQMSLLDKQDLGLKMEAVDIHRLLGEIVEAFSLQLEQRNGAIATSLLATPNVVQADPMHLRQMFTNLLDNANKYSPESPDIRIQTQSTEEGIEISIQDKGLGINRDALRKIFDRFYRVPTGNIHDVKGFGLGLSYVQTMALAHGGHVYAQSKPGAGSTFYLFLPYSHA